MITLPEPVTVVRDLTLPECPRWHDGAFYFSDVLEGRVFKLAADGTAHLVVEFSGDHAGGLGFLPSGDLLVTIQNKRTLSRVANGQQTPYADLTPVTRFRVNDMIVGRGLAYVSQPGYEIFEGIKGGPPPPTDILLVRPDGSVEIAASGVHSPNGLALSPDGATLFVAESTARRISTYAVQPDGTLTDFKVFGELPDGGHPDGICLDDQGGVWVATPVSRDAPGRSGPGVVRLGADGQATHVVPLAENRLALACAFGGADRSTLYVCTVADVHGENAFAPRHGRLEQVRLPFTGAGSP